MEHKDFLGCNDCVCIAICRQKQRTRLVRDCVWLDNFLFEVKQNMQANTATEIHLVGLNKFFTVYNVVSNETRGLKNGCFTYSDIALLTLEAYYFGDYVEDANE